MRILLLLFLLIVPTSCLMAEPTGATYQIETCSSLFQEKLIQKLMAESIKTRMVADGFTAVSIRVKKRTVKTADTSPPKQIFNADVFTPGFGTQMGNSSNGGVLYSYTTGTSPTPPHGFIMTFNFQDGVNQNGWNGALPLTPVQTCTNVVVFSASIRATQTILDANGKKKRVISRGDVESQPIVVKGFYKKYKIVEG